MLRSSVYRATDLQVRGSWSIQALVSNFTISHYFFDWLIDWLIDWKLNRNLTQYSHTLSYLQPYRYDTSSANYAISRYAITEPAESTRFVPSFKRRPVFSDTWLKFFDTVEFAATEWTDTRPIKNLTVAILRAFPPTHCTQTTYPIVDHWK